MTVYSIEEHIANVESRAPDGDHETIFALAHVERQLHHYGERLETDVGDAVAAEWFRKWTAEAHRLRSELGIGKKKEAPDASIPPGSIRRDR